MGFDLNQFFEHLFDILEADKKDSKKVKELKSTLLSWRKYAEECGQLR